MEKVSQSYSRNSPEIKTRIVITRYGNVMASRGSVIPLFIEQIKAGKPLSITDPSMTRFMMTLDDAVELVWFAFNNAQNGDMFVQKAPAATVEVLAIALKELYNASNPINIIGTRHGEKLFETLVNREEMAKAIDMGDYYRIPADNRDLNYGKFFSEGEKNVSQLEDYTSHNTHRLDVEGMKNLLMKLSIIRKDILGEDITSIYEP
jgi:UDP-glucose 4-epimerase